MSQSLAQVLVHVVFSTKHREPLIVPALRPRLHAYLATALLESGSASLQVGGTADHIHALFALSRTQTIADAMQTMKANSSRWMKQQLGCAFAWQAGYGAFSVASSQKSSVIKYIQCQESRHRTMTFQDEFRLMLKRSGIEWDERFVWD